MKTLLSWGVVPLLLASAAFAALSAWSALARGRERDQAVRALSEARRLLASRARDRSGAGAQAGSEVGLKALVESESASSGLALGFLSEAEKEAGKGRRERQVSARLLRTPHEKLVRFLAALEAKGAGAVVKELHLRPSKEDSGTYEDVELTYSRVGPVIPTAVPSRAATGEGRP